MYRTAAALALMCLAIVPAAHAQSTQGPSASQSSQGDQSLPSALPPFLPTYYGRAFAIDGEQMTLASHEEKEHLSRYLYTTAGRAVSLTVEHFECDIARCKIVLNNVLNSANTEASKAGGQFRRVSDSGFRVEWAAGRIDTFVMVVRLPASLLFWTYGVPHGSNLDVNALFDDIEASANRQRYEEALMEGNVEMGHWGPQIHDYARRLLREGRTTEALAVLKDLIATSPFDYEAHMDVAANTPDPAAAKSSEMAVLANAEGGELIAKAARLLGQAEPSIASLPPLGAGEKGLQLILLPLPPCDLRVVEEAARIYEKITNVPTKIMRLPGDWQWGAADRIADQRLIQQTILQAEAPTVDFTGWTLERYQAELLKIASAKDALNQFTMKAFVEKLASRPGQYRVDPHVQRLQDMLAGIRSQDARTMYVGVTEANIFSGDTNYVFSQSRGGGSGAVGLLSYAMMEARTLGEPYESRKRLAERMAKELVPASLKSLNIPRPADPSDPYSYSDGVDRLAQKTLILSEPVREALDKFRSCVRQVLQIAGW